MPENNSLQVTDAASEAVAVAPRVRLQDIEAAIAAKYEFVGGHALKAMEMPAIDGLDRFSICLLVMQNGFVVIGKAAPASPENFNPDLGRQFAYEDAIRQLWPLMGYALRDRLHEGW